MPGKVKVRVVAGRNLPVMDRSSDTTDAFAEVKLGDTTFKTDVYRKSLNPAWNSDWFKFEVDDLELQDEPLQIRIMDYDTYSANDAIGKVYIDLNPLLLPQPGQRPASLTDSSGQPVTGGGCVMSGWLPVYDTMHGIRGEVHIIVKVELFSDLNKFRQSSCGVQFFCCPEVPEGFKAQFVPGFVEELVVNDDPEYKWIDKIRTPRASNEARQLLFSKLSGEVRRKIGLKALELGGNAVIGYRQNFDFEGESGIVVRGIGTAVTLSRLQQGEPGQGSQLSPGISTSAQASSSPPRTSRENSAGLESVSRPRPSQLGSSNSSSAFTASAGPALRLIPATPVDPSMSANDTLDRLDKPSPSSSTALSDLTIELEVSNSSKTSPNLSQSSSYPDKNFDTTMSRTSSAKSRTSSISDRAASDLQKSAKASQVKTSKKSGTSTLGSFREHSVKTKSNKEERVSPNLRRTNSEKQPKSKSKSKPSTLQKSIRLVKKKSLRKEDAVPDATCSVPSPGKLSKKNSFYKVMDKLRGISRRSSMVSGESGGQIEFLESISRMSDSRIVENWLLSLDDDQQNPDPVDGPSSFDPPQLENTNDNDTNDTNDNLAPPKSRTEELVTPTNEHFEQDTKAISSAGLKIVFDISSEDLSNLEDESEDKFEKRCSRFNSRAFGRQISESSEYTTDTHDTGETAHVTAINTLRNTNPIFTSEGDEIRKVNSSPLILASTSSPLEDLEVEAINSDKTDSHLTTKSNETVKTVSSTTHRPCSHIPSEGSDAQGASAGSSSSEKYSARHIRAVDKEMPEFPFLTITKLPPGFLLHLGGMVSSKSVKLLEELDDREDSDAREAWWVEIRQEVRSHAKALGCNMVVGYQEKTVIWEDVLILTSSGTAAVCNLGFMAELDTSGPVSGLMPGRMPGSEARIMQSWCSVCHIPYLESSVPFPIKLVKCGQCGRGKVPDILLTTVEPPPMVEILGQGGLIQARVLRLKKDLKGENNAREVSDALPFMEYEIHRQLVNKLKVKGMNAIFGLSVNLSMSDRMLVALATGTAVYLSALPSPDMPKVLDTTCQVQDPSHLAKLQTKLKEKVEANKEYFGLVGGNPRDATDAEVEEKGAELELSAGNKDTCVLEVDDIDDADIVDSLLDAHPPPGFQVISVHTPVGEDRGQAVSLCQTFSQVWRGKLPCTSRDFSSASQHMVASVCFKLRRMQPCLISSLEWNVDLDDENEVQISVSGVAVAFVDKDKKEETKKKDSTQEDKELMFHLEEVQPPQLGSSEGSDRQSQVRLRQVRPPPYFLAATNNPRVGITMTPAPFIPGARIDHHLGSLNFFFIRESTNIRETGGLSTFVQRFLSEVLGILRSHVSSLGGNAVTSYFMSSCILSHVPHKNQAQCLINVGGDIVSGSHVC